MRATKRRRGATCLGLALLAGSVLHCEAGDGDYVFGDGVAAGEGGEVSGTGSPNAGRGGAATGGTVFGGMATGGTSGASVPPGASGARGGPETNGRGVGAACTDDSGCDEGNCVDRVCCESECTGCNACAAELTGRSHGICAPVLAGQDPHSWCDDESAINECGLDGSCDGAGACRRAGAGHVCVPATCSGNEFVPAATCDGAGTCNPGTREDCGIYPCEPSGCAKTCASHADCDAGSYCKTASGTCAVKAPNGTPASEEFECASGIVADGLCCDAECAGCRACSGAPLTSGLPGQCLHVVAGEDPHGACAQSSEPCGTDGACNGAGDCRSTPREGEPCSPEPNDGCVVNGACRSGVCTGATQKECPVPLGQCRVRGTCDPETGNCSQPYAEDNTACDDGNACTQNDRCQSGACSGTAVPCNSPPACKTTTTCSDGECNYTQNATNGLRDEKCPSATPFCFSGACTECRTNADCSGTTPHCEPVTHDCVCRLPSSGNMLANPGFDEWQVGGEWPLAWGWDGNTEGALAVPDSESCAGSRGVRWTAGGPGQCVNVTSSKTYYLGAKVKDGVSGNVVQVTYYSGTNCGGSILSDEEFDIAPQSSWKALSWQLTTPSTAKSALMSIIGETQSADQVFFNPDGSQF